jgi:ElaA protein
MHAVADVSSTVRTARFDELSPRDLHDILRLRSEVFVVEQACLFLEIDGRDPEPAARHLWLRDDTGALAGAARLLHEGGDTWSIGRVVTRPDLRSRGIAARLLTEAIGEADALGATAIDLGAQAHLASWYARFGFEVCGAEYVEDGIPHVPMRRPAAAAAP